MTQDDAKFRKAEKEEAYIQGMRAALSQIVQALEGDNSVSTGLHGSVDDLYQRSLELIKKLRTR